MYKVEDHIKEIDGVKYVPYDIVIKVIEENYNKTISDLDRVQTLVKDAVGQFSKTISDLDKND